MPRIKRLFVNGGEAAIDADPQQNLLEILRDQAGLTGAKYGCGEGQCGACTVLVDGKPVRSCITPVEAAQGKPVTTIEGLAKGGLHPLQEAFLQEDAFQCGYCTPGMIMSASALLRSKAKKRGTFWTSKRFRELLRGKAFLTLSRRMLISSPFVSWMAPPSR